MDGSWTEYEFELVGAIFVIRAGDGVFESSFDSIILGMFHRYLQEVFWVLMLTGRRLFTFGVKGVEWGGESLNWKTQKSKTTFLWNPRRQKVLCCFPSISRDSVASVRPPVQKEPSRCTGRWSSQQTVEVGSVLECENNIQTIYSHSIYISKCCWDKTVG